MQTRKLAIIAAFFATFFIFAGTASAQIEYHTLAPIENSGTEYVGKEIKIGETDVSLSKYLNNMFKLGIALCTGLAVLMIIIGGIQYVSSDAWSSKTDGKERIFAALLGLVIAFGSYALLNTINPDLLGTELTLQKLKIEEIKAEYNKVYAQWSDTDDEALDDPNNTAYQAALEKWNKMQSEIEKLNTTYGPQVDPAKANVGPANQKVLDQINKGTNCSTSAHCYAGAEALGRMAGVNFNSVYQGNAYVVGGETLSGFGSARDPVPGEMVDYRFYTDNTRQDPFHTVIVYSNDGNGNYTVWDWKHDTTTGLRKVNLNFDKPGTKGYVGRIYVPQNR